MKTDSPYGSPASLCASDVARAEAIGDRIETGNVFMNAPPTSDYLDPALRWTGCNGHRVAAAASPGNRLSQPHPARNPPPAERLTDDPHRQLVLPHRDPLGAAEIAEIGGRLHRRGITRPLLSDPTGPRRHGDHRERTLEPRPRRRGLGRAVFAEVGLEPGPRKNLVRRPSGAFREGGYDGVGDLPSAAARARSLAKTLALPCPAVAAGVGINEDIGDWWTRATHGHLPPSSQVPTTAGTGSEVPGLGHHQHRKAARRRSSYHPKMLPAPRSSRYPETDRGNAECDSPAGHRARRLRPLRRRAYFEPPTTTR